MVAWHRFGRQRHGQQQQGQARSGERRPGGFRGADEALRGAGQRERRPALSSRRSVVRAGHRSRQRMGGNEPPRAIVRPRREAAEVASLRVAGRAILFAAPQQARPAQGQRQYQHGGRAARARISPIRGNGCGQSGPNNLNNRGRARAVGAPALFAAAARANRLDSRGQHGRIEPVLGRYRCSGTHIMGDISISHDAGSVGRARLSPERSGDCGRPAHASLLGPTLLPSRGRVLALGLVLLLAACAPPRAPLTGAAAPRPPLPVRGTLSETASQAPTPLDTAAAAKEGRGAGPLVSPGTGVFVAPPAPRTARVDVAPDGDVSFNFVNADVREVVREILGNQLHLNYVVDSKIQAMITAQTGGPVPRQAVLPTLESVLRANGLALVQVNGLYRVLAIEDAAKSSAGAVAARGQAGYAVRVLPLHFVSGTKSR